MKNEETKEKDDLLRSEVINDKLGFTKFSWAKEFVFSNELNKDVALAGMKDDLVLIDLSGEVLETLVND